MRIPLKDNLLPMESQKVLDFYACRDTEILISGPRNCSKSMALWLRTIALHEKHPNFQSAVVRSEMKSIATTVVPQLQNKVFKYPFGSRKNPFELYGGVNRPQHIDFRNGGRMTFGGMDDDSKVLGGEYDLIVYNQPEREKRESAWTNLMGCGLGGRAGNWIVDGEPFFQIIGDANPDAPTHWLMSRKKEGQLTFIEFRHEDNPLHFRNGDWTPQGKATREGLIKSHSGYMLQRMVYGEWVAAEGVVYIMFNKNEQGELQEDWHVKPVSRGDIPSDWKWFMAVDWGHNNASVCQLWATSPSFEKHIMFREAYITQHDVYKFLPYVQSTQNGEFIETVFPDVDPGKNEFLFEAGYHITPPKKPNMKLFGIDLCKDWLSKPEDTVIFNKNALWHGPDTNLNGKPQKTVDEFPLYSYKEEDRRKGDYTDEEPNKKWDHGMDAMRYYFAGLYDYAPFMPIAGKSASVHRRAA